MLLFTVPSPRRRLWWTLAALAILGMAWSRTYLQVHWFSDVLGGSLLGVGIAIAVFGGAQYALRSGGGESSRKAANDLEAVSAPP